MVCLMTDALAKTQLGHQLGVLLLGVLGVIMLVLGVLLFGLFFSKENLACSALWVQK